MFGKFCESNEDCMTWKELYFGQITREEICIAIQDEDWQCTRRNLKGMELEDKRRALSIYYLSTYKRLCRINDLRGIRMLRVRVTNYVTALARGGLLKVEDYR